MRHPFACPEHRTSGPTRCRPSRKAVGARRHLHRRERPARSLVAIRAAPEPVRRLRRPELDHLGRRKTTGHERVARHDALDLVPVIAACDDDTAGSRNSPSGDDEATGVVVLVQLGNVLTHERVDLRDRSDVAEQHDEHQRLTVPLPSEAARLWSCGLAPLIPAHRRRISRRAGGATAVKNTQLSLRGSPHGARSGRRGCPRRSAPRARRARAGSRGRARRLAERPPR